MTAGTRPFHEFLSGPQAFYDQVDYATVTEDEFKMKRLPVSYTYNTESRAMRIAKLVLAIIIFPIGIGILLHAFGGSVAVPASRSSSSKRAVALRERVTALSLLADDWKYKRFTVECDGYEIDALVTAKPETLGNKRFILVSGGNCALYEETLELSQTVKDIASAVAANIISFNYPGTAASSGLVTRAAMAKAYRAMQHFLEDKKRGVGATAIIGYGHSIGGGVQAEVWKSHSRDKSIKYVLVKRHPFSSTSKTVEKMFRSPFLGSMTKLFGWNINCLDSSLNLTVPEIILQTRRPGLMFTSSEIVRLTDGSQVANDGIIHADASLAKCLLESKVSAKGKKVLLGVPETHNGALFPSTIGILSKLIKELLDEQVVSSSH